MALRIHVEVNQAAMLALSLGLPYRDGMVDVTDAKVDLVDRCLLCDRPGDLVIRLCRACSENGIEHVESFGGLLPVKIARYRKWIERQLEAKAR